MTRENKLALVLGFGLILFVGILISDHFSTARRQESADLLRPHASDPLVEARRQDPHLLDYERPPSPPPPAVRAGELATEAVQPVTPTPTISMPDLQRPTPPLHAGGAGPVTPGASTRVASGPDDAVHAVGGGETLTSICRRHYGDAALVAALAAYNGLSDPDELRAGHRLRLPPATALGRPATAATTTPPVSTPAPPRTYTVRSGDTLSEIAQHVMGTSRSWRRLLEYNADVIDDPDRLVVGTTLKVPPG
ncbi:MAG: LysM peptidoglycan-binding domain-containing protein [Planctomycetota bacterium]|jgi:nucleoid-associated protein YgaU